jgi:uncharacterized tellurite resistance protein B-like protein
MFKALRKIIIDFSSHELDKPHFSDDDHRLAAAALMVHIVSVDGVVDDSERVKLRQVVMRSYELSERETDDLIDLARKRDLEAVDLYSFTSVLKRRLDEKERMRLVEMMWEMVYADGLVHEFEDNTVWRIAELLGISSRDRMRLKKTVESRTPDDA